MKKFILTALFCITGITTTWAQSSMTDDQVMQYIIKEHSAGTSQAQIVTKLMQKGVDISQIRRIRNKYQKEINDKGASATADAAVNETDKMMRKGTNTKRERTTPTTEEKQEMTTTQRRQPTKKKKASTVTADKPSTQYFSERKDELTEEDVDFVF